MSEELLERKKRIDGLKEKYNTSSVFSWSKIDVFKTDKWLYYLKYILKAKPDNRNGAYAVLGSAVHDQLQRFYEEDITNKDMVDAFEDKYEDFTLMGFKFDKSDDQRNQKIAEKYVYCCKHFLERHKKVSGKTMCEAFVPLILTDEKGNNKIVQGYIDFLNNDNEYLKVIDYKTSTIYSKKVQEDLSGQLKIYGLAIHKSLEVPIEKIKLYWNFLKYISVDCLQANGKWKTRNIERSSIGESLKSSIGMWGKRLGYSEDEITSIQDECVLSNSIDSLPNDIREKYVVNECLVEVEFKEDDVNIFANYLLDSIREIEELELEYELTNDEMLFWQDVKTGDEYRLFNLCDYSTEHHLPFKKYLEQKKDFVENNIVSDEDIEKLFS